MQVFDIVLAGIRALVVIDVVKGVWALLFAAVQATLMVSFAHVGPVMRPFEIAALGAPLGSIVIALIILAASRPIARFACRLAGA